MTYIGTVKSSAQVFNTLVLADNDDEAKMKIQKKYASWRGNEGRTEDVLIYAFGDGHRI